MTKRLRRVTALALTSPTPLLAPLSALSGERCQREPTAQFEEVRHMAAPGRAGDRVAAKPRLGRPPAREPHAPRSGVGKPVAHEHQVLRSSRDLTG